MEPTYIPEYEQYLEETYRGYEIIHIRKNDIHSYQVVKDGIPYGHSLLDVQTAKRWVDMLIKEKENG